MGCYDFSDKMAVVTGGARGIGKEIAVQLAEGGADIWLGDMLEEDMQATAKEIEALGVKCGYTKTDVSKPDQIEKLYDDAMAASKNGRMDILIHAAGIIVTGSLLKASQEEIQRITDVNIMGTFNALKTGVNKMIPHKTGKIVLISSVAGRRGFKVQGHYNATKAAGINFAQSCAVESAKYGINVNTVCPGIIRTQMWDRILEEAEEEKGITQQEEWESYMDVIPQGRAQTPAEIANVTVFLCTELASAVTGQAINVDGGWTLN